MRLQATEANDAIIRLMALRALVLDQQGDLSGALDDLRVALALARPEGYVRSFLDAGAPMRNLLLTARAHDMEASYVTKLLAAFEAQDRAISAVSNRAAPGRMLVPESALWVEAISSRERDVLRLLAAGHTNKAIADTLGITITTVKSHAGSIYSKLGVKNRTQAVARARELGLLS
jgi:LuxR family maltose regulon positive regulatory protein